MYVRFVIVYYVYALLYKHQYIMYTVNKVHLYCIVLIYVFTLFYYLVSEGSLDPLNLC